MIFLVELPRRTAEGGHVWAVAAVCLLSESLQHSPLGFPRTWPGRRTMMMDGLHSSALSALFCARRGLRRCDWGANAKFTL